MAWRVPLVGGFLLASALLGMALGPVSATAQVRPDRTFHDGMRTGIGYNAAFPDALAGAGVWRFFGSGPFGAFVDGKMTTGSLTGKSSYCPVELGECTDAWVAAERGTTDFALRDEDEFLGFNLGGMWVATPEMAFLLGGGLARKRRIREYLVQDEMLWITENGTYFVNRGEGTDWAPQVVVGGLIRLSHLVAVSVAWESRMTGFTFGGYVVLP